MSIDPKSAVFIKGQTGAEPCYYLCFSTQRPLNQNLIFSVYYYLQERLSQKLMSKFLGADCDDQGNLCLLFDHSLNPSLRSATDVYEIMIRCPLTPGVKVAVSS